MVAEHAPFGWLAQLRGTWAMYADSARFLKGRTVTAVDIGVDQEDFVDFCRHLPIRSLICPCSRTRDTAGVSRAVTAWPT